MAKKIEKWICDTCGKLHDDEEKASACEAQHYTVKEVVAYGYDNFAVAPESIIVTLVNKQGHEIKNLEYRVERTSLTNALNEAMKELKKSLSLKSFFSKKR